MTDSSELRPHRGDPGLEERSPVPGPDRPREGADTSFFRSPEKGEPVSLRQFLFWKAVYLLYFAVWAGIAVWNAWWAQSTPLRVVLLVVLVLTTPSLGEIIETRGEYLRRRRAELQEAADAEGRPGESGESP